MIVTVSSPDTANKETSYCRKANIYHPIPPLDEYCVALAVFDELPNVTVYDEPDVIPGAVTIIEPLLKE